MSVFKIEVFNFQKDNFFQMAVFAKAIFARIWCRGTKDELKDLITFLRKFTKMNIGNNMLYDATGVASVRIEHINKNNLWQMTSASYA